jgi:hypothetical protein
VSKGGILAEVRKQWGGQQWPPFLFVMDSSALFLYLHYMTKIEFNLPDALAKEAEKAGLLVPEVFERLLREQLRRETVDRLFEDMDRMAAIPLPYPMTPEEVAGEIRAMRAEQRETKAA